GLQPCVSKEAPSGPVAIAHILTTKPMLRARRGRMGLLWTHMAVIPTFLAGCEFALPDTLFRTFSIAELQRLWGMRKGTLLTSPHSGLAGARDGSGSA